MNITFSLNEKARTSSIGNKTIEGYIGSGSLVRAFANRGHILNIIHPNDLYKINDEIYSKNIYGFDNNVGFYKKDVRCLLSGDVFFVYGLGEDNDLDISKNFMNYLYQIEKQFNLVLNSAESTSYEFKPKQKTLDLPWIPKFQVNSKNDLVSLVKYNEKIIAKPTIGFAGKGVHYIGNIDDIDFIPSHQINYYVYEKFLPAREERRYLFLDNQLIIRRKIGKTGYPGKEEVISVDLFEGIDREIKLSKKIISNLEMFYGSVDFRGEYLLEINGSGTGVAPPTINGQEDCYNIPYIILQAIERKVDVNELYNKKSAL